MIILHILDTSYPTCCSWSTLYFWQITIKRLWFLSILKISGIQSIQVPGHIFPFHLFLAPPGPLPPWKTWVDQIYIYLHFTFMNTVYIFYKHFQIDHQQQKMIIITRHEFLTYQNCMTQHKFFEVVIALLNISKWSF